MLEIVVVATTQDVDYDDYVVWDLHTANGQNIFKTAERAHILHLPSKKQASNHSTIDC